jgi:hypothetical protein
MTDRQPITPPLSLINQWWDEVKQNAKYDEPIGPLVATKAAQWGADQQLKFDAEQIYQAWQKGADQELDACCEWLDSQHHSTTWSSRIRAARRPKPPIKADQALAVLHTAPKAGTPTVILDIDQFDTILLALGRMKELEKPND